MRDISSGAVSDSSQVPVLDPAQLKRIQAMHRGFLYQHLYAVACLLQSAEGLSELRVERDEDIELRRAGGTIYLQVKTRSRPVLWGDINSAIERFGKIREAHVNGHRAGSAAFGVVANNAFDTDVARPELVDAVLIQGAGLSNPLGLPAPPDSVETLLALTIELAKNYRLSALRPETLVWKLASMVAASSAGVGLEVFKVADLDSLCELTFDEFRAFPRVDDYRPQKDEPVLGTERIMLVCGHSGSGKSAWAAQAAAHTSGVAVYFCCTSTPGQQLVARLADAVLASLVRRSAFDAASVSHVNRTGEERLHALDEKAWSIGCPLLLVVDDAHHQAAETLVGMVRITKHAQWILLGHPSSDLQSVAARLGASPQQLSGWDRDTVATVLAEHGCKAASEAVEAVANATHGAPLFVLHAAREISRGQLDPQQYATALTQGVSGAAPQQRILEQSVAHLPHELAQVASALAAADIALDPTDWVACVTGPLGLGADRLQREVQAAIDAGLATITVGHAVRLHDALRPLLRRRFISKEQELDIQRGLVQRVLLALRKKPTSERLLAYIGLLASLECYEEIPMMANWFAEWITDADVASTFRGQLRAILSVRDLAKFKRFWVHDTLAYFASHERNEAELARELEAMRPLATEAERLSLLQKELFLLSLRGDIEALRAIFGQVDPASRATRLLRYAVAIGEADCGDSATAFRISVQLMEEYLADIGLTREDLQNNDPRRFVEELPAGADRDELIHAANCADVAARAASQDPALASLSASYSWWAWRFYATGGAVCSTLRAGYRVAVGLIAAMRPLNALEFVEREQLPRLQERGASVMMIPVRVQYALLSAGLGDIETAKREVEALRPYTSGLSDEEKRAFERDVERIEALGAFAISEQ